MSWRAAFVFPWNPAASVSKQVAKASSIIFNNVPKSWSPQTKDSEGWAMGRPTEVEGQRVETTVPVWLHNMVGSNWGWASGVSFIPGVDDPDNCVSVCG